jgi:hypothetical protein
MFLKWLFALLHSQAGQVPAESEPENSGTESTGEIDASADPVTDNGGFEAAPTQADALPAQAQEQTFADGSNLDPRKLPPEVQPIFKAMQAAYTKKMQGLAEVQKQAALVDRFYSDPSFADQTLQQWAAQRGYQIVPQGQQAQQRGSGQPGQVNQQIVEDLKQSLTPELQWMADALGPALSNVLSQQMRQVIQPLNQYQQKQALAQRESEYDRHAEELSGQIPHWQEHEDTMAEINAFLMSPSMSHPKFGNKLQLLYNAATANAASMAKATQRMSDAVKNRSTQARNGSRPAPDIAKTVASAKTSEDAFAAAARFARQKHGLG